MVTNNWILLQNRTFNVRYQSEPCAVNIIDYNNDTFLDVTVANHYSSNVGIFLGFNNGLFDDLEMFSVGYGALLISVVSSDFNNDIRTDSATAIEVRVLRSTAGCGPMGLNVDKLLQKLDRNTLIPCCVQHDVCYQTCGNKRSVCDDRFYTCLKTACSRQTPVSRECSTLATSMYTAVRGGGIPSFQRDQLNSKCAKKLFDD
ncbi:unnamed protein product [Adineta ricciae]|uniref:Uncharacterized protein n=1 Tax=Adineta ricciae TaxID=249248 RepID=A0A815KMH8_ADIRI|nr:unnamed protein product [Adineta ricciae]